MGLDDDHSDYWRRGANIKARIDRLTPSNLTGRQAIEEIYLFAQGSGLRVSPLPPLLSLRYDANRGL